MENWDGQRLKEFVLTLVECVVESRDDTETMFRLEAQIMDRTTHCLGWLYKARTRKKQR